MSIILKGIDLPEPIKDQYTHLELYVRSDGVVFDDDLEEVGKAIQIPKGHGDIKDVSGIIKGFDEKIALAEASPMVIYADAFLNDALVWSAEYITIKDDIDNAPTILEAEE